MNAENFQPVAECGVTTQAEAAGYHRQWLVANDSGQWLNRSLCPRLADVSVELRLGYLVLKAPGMLRMDIPLDVIEDDDSVRYSMKVGEQVVDVIDEGELDFQLRPGALPHHEGASRYARGRLAGLSGPGARAVQA
jgi:hypothetical protein